MPACHGPDSTAAACSQLRDETGEDAAAVPTYGSTVTVTSRSAQLLQKMERKEKRRQGKAGKGGVGGAPLLLLSDLQG